MALQTDVTALQDAIDTVIADSEIMHQIVHGDETVEVQTESGPRKSISREISEQMLASGIFADTAAGLAATVEGNHFSAVAIDDADYLVLYRHDAGAVATPVKRYPSSDLVNQLRNSAHLAGNNRTVNALFAADPIGSTAAPTGYSATKGGGKLLSDTQIVNFPNTDLQTDRALQITVSNDGTNITDYQLYQTYLIPDELIGDTTAVARFSYTCYREDVLIEVDSYAYLEDINSNILGGFYPTKITLDGAANEVFRVAFDVPITDANARQIRIAPRLLSNSLLTPKNVYITALFFDFNRPNQVAFDINRKEEIAAISADVADIKVAESIANDLTPVVLRVSEIESNSLVKAPWEIGTNRITNPQFDKDPIGHTSSPSDYTLLVGGLNVVLPLIETVALATPVGGTCLKSTHFYDGVTHTDLQLAQTIDIPAQFWGDTTLTARIIFYVNRQSDNVSVSSYSEFLDENGASLGGSYPTKVSTDGANGDWFAAIFDLAITDPLARKITTRPRLQAVQGQGVFPAETVFCTGVYAGFNRPDQTQFDRNYSDEIGVAVQLAVPPLVNAAVSAAVIQRNQIGLNDRAVDSRGNVCRFIPTEEIVTWGDSLTDQDWAAGVATRYSNTRTCINNGIGGETSLEILNRIQGYQIDLSGVTWTPGIIRLRATRTLPPRLIDETYRASWEKYGATVNEPDKVEFLNADGRIAVSYDRYTAACTSDGGVKLGATGHEFLEGEQIHFRDESLPAELYRYKTYYVRNPVAGVSFEISEFPAASSITISAGTATALGDFYYDWTYTDENTDVSVVTHSQLDSMNVVIWMGDNNGTTPAETMEHVRVAVEQIKTISKRFVVLTGLTVETAVTGTQINDEMLEYNSLVLREYPDNSIDIRSYLMSKYDPNNAQDVIDVANGVHPSSVRIDAIHLNSTGVNHVADEVYRFFSERSW